VCRWRTRDDGSRDPNIRTIIKPLLNLFHGERGGKRWKNAVDIALRTLHPKSVTELIEVSTLQHSNRCILVTGAVGMGLLVTGSLSEMLCAWCVSSIGRAGRQT
jgi:hypothetical protein